MRGKRVRVNGNNGKREWGERGANVGVREGKDGEVRKEKKGRNVRRVGERGGG